MSGIVGFFNFKEKIMNSQEILMNMNNKLMHRGSDKDGYYIGDNIALGFRTILRGDNQPISFNFEGNTYVIVYDGNIYNLKELKLELEQYDFCFSTNSDAEVILKGYIHFRESFVNKLNGVFAFAIFDKNQNSLFIARDHFGIKPFYYTIINNTFVFASEIKALFQFPNVNPKMDSMGICELIGIGPAHTPGVTVFKDIYEIKPAHYGIYNDGGFHSKSYWKLISKPHTDSLGKTCETIKYLLEDSIKKQLVSDLPVCSFLSGGLDSSIISLYAANYYKVNDLKPLDTYSVDYVDNDKNFVKSDFQPNSDNYYIELMSKRLYSEHHNIVLDTPELADALEAAMIARDVPGMADIDSSLLLFCKNVKPEASIALTGECADEIFAGYPWFFREDALSSNTFPWSIAIQERQTLLNNQISEKVDLKAYIDYRYNESLNEVSLIGSDSKETLEKKKISHLTLNWFMQTLLERADRMGMYNGFEMRVPFCDYRIVEYVWNIPWEIKALNGREKGLLRYIMKDSLPSEIVDRKKSPYPKTHNPTYLNKVKEMLTNIMKQLDAPINTLFNKEYVWEILNTDGKSFSRPWFGQLMTGPQLMAYLCQVNMWLEMYEPKIEL
mgnify:FL=1